MMQSGWTCMCLIYVLNLAYRIDAAKPVGIHLDIEVHSLSGWNNNQQAWGNEWLDLMEKLSTTVSGTTSRLTVDIAMQYSDVVQITRNGDTKSLADWTLDTIDHVVLMAYRDYGTEDDCEYTHHGKCGPDDSIIFHSEELMKLSREDSTIKIGVETNPAALPDKVNFGMEGESYMERVLENVIDHFSPTPQFEGIVVHDFEHAIHADFTNDSLRSTAASRHCRSVWMWDDCYVLSGSSKASCASKSPQQLVDIAHQFAINNIIVNARWFFDLTTFRNDLINFVNVLGENGISVELLLADHGWSRSSMHDVAVEHVEKAASFIEEMSGSVSDVQHCVPIRSAQATSHPTVSPVASSAPVPSTSAPVASTPMPVTIPSPDTTPAPVPVVFTSTPVVNPTSGCVCSAKIDDIKSEVAGIVESGIADIKSDMEMLKTNLEEVMSILETLSPVAATPAPVANPAPCVDRTGKWRINGTKLNWCTWLPNKGDNQIAPRCAAKKLYKHCPKTCGTCTP